MGAKARVSFRTMRALRILLCTPLLCLAISCGGMQKRFQEADRNAIADVLARQKAAWNRGDIPGFMDGYVRGSELVFTSGGNIKRGWQATLHRYLERYSKDTSTMGTLDFQVLELTPLGADGAVVLGRWSLAGLADKLGGVFSIVFVRSEDGWRIVHDHTSSDPTDLDEKDVEVKDEEDEGHPEA